MNSQLIKIGDRVTIDASIENKYRPGNTPRPTYEKTFIMTDTDTDRAIVQSVDHTEGWIVSYGALRKA